MVLAAKWTRLALSHPAPLRLSSHNLAVVASTAYIFGGELKPRTPVTPDLIAISLKSGATQTFSPDRAPSSAWPAPRVGAAMAEVHGTLYLWGGRGGKDMGTFASDEDLWAFDTNAATWTKLTTTGDRPEQRSFHVLTALGDTLYLHAGCPTKGRLGTLHSLSLSTLTWTALPSAPGPARGGTVLVPLTASNSLLRFGGFAGYELGGPLTRFAVATNEWTEIPLAEDVDGPPKRSVHAFLPVKTAVDENVVAVMLMGEREGAPAELGHDGAGAFHADAWALVSSSGSFSWIALPPSKGTTDTPQPRGWFAASTWDNDKIVIHGGLNEKNERLDDMWILEIVDE